MFLDTSKNGQRRWCSMATCGNDAKVKKHRMPEEKEGSVGFFGASWRRLPLTLLFWVAVYRRRCANEIDELRPVAVRVVALARLRQFDTTSS